MTASIKHYDRWLCWNKHLKFNIKKFLHENPDNEAAVFVIFELQKEIDELESLRDEGGD